MAFGVFSFPPSTGQKWKILQFFFDIVTTHNDEICYVKHVLDPLCALFSMAASQGDQPGHGDSLCPERPRPRPRDPYPWDAFVGPLPGDAVRHQPRL